MSTKVNYSLPSGFDIELLPGEKRLELHILDTIRAVYEKYGFSPIETPAVERLEVLQAKGNQGDNILYGISPILPPQNPGSQNGDTGTDARALKFDQTVPLAAYVARHLNDLVFPFARYQMDMVFRGERAKKGRYRQFRQCDIDVVGRGELSLLWDAQMPAIISEIFGKLGLGPFLIRINNRKVLTGFFTALGLGQEAVGSSLKIVDMLDKVGAAKVIEMLIGNGCNQTQAQSILDFMTLQGSKEELLSALQSKIALMPEALDFAKGVEELAYVVARVRDLGVPEEQFAIDLSIARGLNYYTGTVYETTLIGHESLGSICSGGRYEELMGIFTNERMPGVGISIGLSRILVPLMAEGLLKPLAQSPADVFVVLMDEALLPEYLKLSQDLRQQGLRVQTSFEARPLGKQIAQAEKLGIPLAILIGSNEWQRQEAQVKILAKREQKTIAIADLGEQLKALLL